MKRSFEIALVSCLVAVAIPLYALAEDAPPQLSPFDFNDFTTQGSQEGGVQNQQQQGQPQAQSQNSAGSSVSGGAASGTESARISGSGAAGNNPAGNSAISKSASSGSGASKGGSANTSRRGSALNSNNPEPPPEAEVQAYPCVGDCLASSTFQNDPRLDSAKAPPSSDLPGTGADIILLSAASSIASAAIFLVKRR